MFKEWIRRAAVWAGLRSFAVPAASVAFDARLEREVRAALTDEALAWAVGTWRKRYL